MNLPPIDSTPDPRLKTAMAEIVAILDKHDVAGIVALTTENSLEYVLHPNASWNCTVIEKNWVRVNSMVYPKEERKEKVENSISSILGFRHISKVFYDGFDEAAEMLSKHFEIGHIMKRLE